MACSPYSVRALWPWPSHGQATAKPRPGQPMGEGGDEPTEAEPMGEGRGTCGTRTTRKNVFDACNTNRKFYRNDYRKLCRNVYRKSYRNLDRKL